MTATDSPEPTHPDLRETRDFCLHIEDGENEEDESTNETASLVTTAAATWCLHRVASRNTDVLLTAFKQLLDTHHTVHEPAPIWEEAADGEEQHQSADERSEKREDTQITTTASRDSPQSGKVQQQAATAAGDEAADDSAVFLWTSATATSPKESVMSAVAAAGDTEETTEDAVPFFPVYEAILQSDWKEERVKREKTRKKKRGGARVTNATAASSGQKGDITCLEDISAQGHSFASHVQSHTLGSSVFVPTSAHEGSFVDCNDTSLEEAVADRQQQVQQQQVQQQQLQLQQRQQDLTCAVNNVPVAATAGTAQWSFTFSCPTCARSTTIDEKSACCRACLLAQYVSQTQNEVRHATRKSSQQREIMCVVSERGSETSQGHSAASASTDSNPNNVISSTNSTGHETGRTHGDYEDLFLEDLLLPPAVPISSALKRVSPDAVRLWNLRARRGSRLDIPTDFLAEVSSSHSDTATRKISNGSMSCNQADTVSISDDLSANHATPHGCEGTARAENSDYTDCREMFDLLRLVQSQKSSAARSKKTQDNDIHVRAQLACLVEGGEDSSSRHTVGWKLKKNGEVAEKDAPREGVAERPEARKLASAVLNVLKKLPQDDTGKDAFLELLLSWYYAGFFTGRLSVCSNGKTPA